MPAFTVISIIDGDTFEVSPHWKWRNETGSRIRPTGYNAPEIYTEKGPAAKDRLLNLICGQPVDLRTAYKIDRGRLLCDVFFQGRNLADYFPQYQH